MKIVDINATLEKRRQAEELERAKDHFKFLLSNMNQADQESLFESIQNQDMELYKKLTEPIIARECMKEFN